MNPIFCIEDDLDTGKSLLAILTHYGYEGIHYADPEEALSVAKTTVPRAAIVDIMLPKMDGFAFSEKLRALPGLEQLPILCITATPSSEIQEKLQVSELPCLVKPFLPFQLKEQLETLLT